MRLLVITQAVDINDPILGFFHRWIEEFSKKALHIHVICLREGVHALPSNVSVHSLGKETHRSRIRAVIRFFSLIRKLRGQYDAVFVHMNQEYILLEGLGWKVAGIPVYMWRNHPAGSFFTYIAVLLSTKVFSTSPFSYTAKFKKNVRMPVGIDTELFSEKKDHVRKPHSILSIGRIAPIKRPDLIVEAVSALHGEWNMSFYGDALARDAQFKARLENRAREIGGGRISFHRGVPNTETPAIYRTHMVSINASPDGQYDKTIFEAMASGALVVVSNKNLKTVVPRGLFFEEGNQKALEEAIEYALALSDDERTRIITQLREYVVREHSLELLSNKLFEEMS